MSEQLSETDRYLRRLADGLDALGPTETQEVLLEVRSHLRDAIAEAGGDEAAALVGFDTPDALAAHILEERGLLGDASGMPEASGARRLAVLAIDIAIWLVLLWFIIFPFVAIGVGGPPSLTTRLLVWSFLAAVIAGTVWWWVKKRRDRGHVTIGMRVVGLRRIRIGESTRLVRVRDLPGAGHGAVQRILAVAAAALVLFFIGALTAEVFSDDDSAPDAETIAAVEEAGYTTAFVSRLYREVLSGARTGDIKGMFAPGAQDAARDLIARRSAGRIDTYSIQGLQLLSSAPPEETWEEDKTYETVMLVRVGEYRRGADSGPLFTYRVVMTLRPAGGSAAAGAFAWEGGWVIESVKKN
jgi:uncharacterized membrane protein